MLHDLNQAARYAAHLIAMQEGGIVAARARRPRSSPRSSSSDVFGLACRVVPDPETGSPLVVPRRPLRGPASEKGTRTGAADGGSGPTGSVLPR